MSFIKCIFYLLLTISLLCLQSCEEEFLMPSPEKIENTKLYSEVIGELFSIWRRVDEGIRNPTVSAGGQVFIDQANVSITGKTLVIDFGNIQRLCADGKTRRGKIEVEINGLYGLPGGSLDIQFIGFRVDDKPVSGQLYMHTTSSSMQPSFTLTSGNFSYKDFQITIDNTIQWISGFESFINLDDTLTFSFTGTATRQSSSFGFNYQTDEKNPLLCVMSCPQRIIQGIVNLYTLSDSSQVELDFIESDGCNDLVRASFINERFSTFIKFSGF